MAKLGLPECHKNFFHVAFMDEDGCATVKVELARALLISYKWEWALALVLGFQICFSLTVHTNCTRGIGSELRFPFYTLPSSF